MYRVKDLTPLTTFSFEKYYSLTLSRFVVRELDYLQASRGEWTIRCKSLPLIAFFDQLLAVFHQFFDAFGGGYFLFQVDFQGLRGRDFGNGELAQARAGFAFDIPRDGEIISVF